MPVIVLFIWRQGSKTYGLYNAKGDENIHT
jgi:hypothetical protein